MKTSMRYSLIREGRKEHYIPVPNAITTISNAPVKYKFATVMAKRDESFLQTTSAIEDNTMDALRKNSTSSVLPKFE